MQNKTKNWTRVFVRFTIFAEGLHCMNSRLVFKRILLV